VARVYIGSFWDKPLTYDTCRHLFEAEQHDLFMDIQSLPRNAALRKLNDLIKRARTAKVHAHIVSHLKTQSSGWFGKDNKKKELIKNLGSVYTLIQRECQISAGDLPDLKDMQEKLIKFDWSKFRSFHKRLLDDVDTMLARDISKLMAMVPQEQTEQSNEGLVRGGHFESERSIFAHKRGEGADAGALMNDWIVYQDKHKYDPLFEQLDPIDGKISGGSAKQEMVKSKLPSSVLGKIWKLADVDKDGFLDDEEFALAMYLINIKLEGHDLPNDLPDHLVPPAKRGFSAT